MTSPLKPCPSQDHQGYEQQWAAHPIKKKKKTKQYNMHIQIIGQKVIPSTWFQKTKKKLLEMNDHSYNGL